MRIYVCFNFTKKYWTNLDESIYIYDILSNYLWGGLLERSIKNTPEAPEVHRRIINA